MENLNRGRKSFSERLSMFVAKKPDKSVLSLILILNVVFICLAAVIISQLAPSTLSTRGFWPSVFYTITMILDAGCISFVVEDVGQTGVIVIVVCLLIVLIGMITFTGAVIGYITNYISSFIENANNGNRKLKVSGHVIILGWNSRGAEIITDYIYTNQIEDVVVLVRDGKEDVEEEISNRIIETVDSDNADLYEEAEKKNLSFFQKRRYIRQKRVHKNVSVIVREGDILSKAQLDNISIDKAQTIIILGKDYQNGKKYGSEQANTVKQMRGNSNVIKTLILVAEITGSEASADDQKIVVEVADEWTRELAEQVVENKENLGKSNIVVIPVYQNLGQLLSQLAVMPELNQIYGELFSNKGAFFESRIVERPGTLKAVNDHLDEYIGSHSKAIPMSVMEAKEGSICFYLCDRSDAIQEVHKEKSKPVVVELNGNYEMNKKNVIILGHNSSMDSLMHGFDAFRNEWNYADERELLNVVVIDDEVSLKKKNYYCDYPYVSQVIAAEIYDKQVVYDTIKGFSDRCEGDITVLILSDDLVPNENIDEEPLTYLMYMDDMLQKRKKVDSSFDIDRYDIIVEILNPQNFEAIQSYNPSHVVISNQYISHMITQIGEHEAIATFYNDILTFDEINKEGYYSKELYLKEAERFFVTIPEECTAHELIHAVFVAGPEDNKSMLMGYIHEGKYQLFVGENADRRVKLEEGDKLILYSNH